ncbi:hypothetical protein SYK_11090 [Pseudodesulfovibrio nedwellii]|uniref:Uncharacterized protein n=2 Tax=Pseudodesulfovibrio nedwellii TaxID=2973072 RepID=A0ABN6S1C1_9BACT|nr:hypothetical protein SYK_11090 [Pseudodesulfovibrio nedwellii]
MRVEIKTVRPNCIDNNSGIFSQSFVRFDGDWNLDELEQAVSDRGLATLTFNDSEMFRDHAKVVAMCENMRIREIKILWSANLDRVPTDGLLKAMRLAGCQQVDMMLDSDDAVEGLFWARRYGFDVRVRNVNGTPYIAEKISYTVGEREAIAERLSGLHAAQFDLAVAYYGARRYSDVMLPLGKAMTLGFPVNELCLNLLACLSAAKHYPDQAAGLLVQAGYGCPHPVVFRNRALLKSWLESGGDIKGIRLELEAAGSTLII